MLKVGVYSLKQKVVLIVVDSPQSLAGAQEQAPNNVGQADDSPDRSLGSEPPFPATDKIQYDMNFGRSGRDFELVNCEEQVSMNPVLEMDTVNEWEERQPPSIGKPVAHEQLHQSHEGNQIFSHRPDWQSDSALALCINPENGERNEGCNSAFMINPFPKRSKACFHRNAMELEHQQNNETGKSSLRLRN